MPDPLLFACGYFLQGWFALGVGLLIAAMSEIYESTEQFLPPMLYLTLPLTGVFSMADWLPQKWREALLWSPLVNNVEMMRGGMFTDVVVYYNTLYVVCWCVALTAIALPLVQRARRRVTFG